MEFFVQELITTKGEHRVAFLLQKESCKHKCPVKNLG
jgi:hypothetical protein